MPKSTVAPPHAGIQIFTAGRHTAVDGRVIDFTDADIAELAETYDPEVFEAPLVIGHPKTEDPAYGWAKSLRLEGGNLFAEPHQVEPQFAELVNTGRVKKISPSIYLRDTPGNPVPGKLYLRHIGFLGAAAPAVKGMPAASLSESDGAPEFAQPWSGMGNVLVDVLQRLRDWFVESNGVEKADQIIPQWQIRAIGSLAEVGDDVKSIPSYAEREPGHPAHVETVMPNADTTPTTAEFAEQQRQADARKTALDNRETELTQREAKARRDDAVEYAESLVKAGKLLPREQAPVVELLLALPADTAVSFAEGDQTVSKPAADALRALLDGLPKRVDFAEKSGVQNTEGAVEFAAPQGTTVDAGRSEIYTRAKQYQAQHANTDWLAAVRAVGG